MVRLIDARLITAITAAMVGLWAVLAGVDIIRFDLARKSATSPQAASDLAAWSGKTGFKAPALEARLRISDDGAGAMDALHRRHDLVTQLLTVRPLSSQGWIALAALRNALAMAPDGVDKAFLMSSLSGPAEGDVMAQRALLGLLLWEASADATRQRTLTDLCALAIYDPSRLRLVLQTKAETTRTAIRDGLVNHGCTARMIATIGL